MSSAGGSSGSFAGEIDELMLWDHVLTNDQIQSNMFSNLDNNETNSVGYWSFNEGSGSLVLDYSGNNNHGIIYGAEWSDDVPLNESPY